LFFFLILRDFPEEERLDDLVLEPEDLDLVDLDFTDLDLYLRPDVELLDERYFFDDFDLLEDLYL
jgi:hypothetical protein